MGTLVRAKILNVLTNNSFAINAGKSKGITRNMKFEILDPLENPNKSNNYSKGKVKITEVYEKFSLAEGYEIEMKGSTSSLGSSQITTGKIRVGDDAIQLI
jgi:hypothetical protein